MARKLKVHDKVLCHGYEGIVTKVCTGQLKGMVEVRLPRGMICVGSSDVKKLKKVM